MICTGYRALRLPVYWDGWEGEPCCCPNRELLPHICLSTIARRVGHIDFFAVTLFLRRERSYLLILAA